MKEKLKAVFMVVAPESEPSKDRSTVSNAAVELLTVFVKDYNQGAEIAKNLVKEGYNAIELCGGFGNKGVAKISEAIGNKVPVGVVRFDKHPGLNNCSGDSIFS